MPLESHDIIIDCHCHAGKGDGLTGPWDTSAPLEKYLRRAAKAGIHRTVLFAAFHSDYAIANREVARMVGSRPDRFLGFAFVNPAHDRGRVPRLVSHTGVYFPSAFNCAAVLELVLYVHGMTRDYPGFGALIDRYWDGNRFLFCPTRGDRSKWPQRRLRRTFLGGYSKSLG